MGQVGGKWLLPLATSLVGWSLAVHAPDANQLGGAWCCVGARQDGGCLHPVTYASRWLNRHEKNYGITELVEALG